MKVLRVPLKYLRYSFVAEIIFYVRNLNTSTHSPGSSSFNGGLGGIDIKWLNVKSEPQKAYLSFTLEKSCVGGAGCFFHLVLCGKSSLKQPLDLQSLFLWKAILVPEHFLKSWATIDWRFYPSGYFEHIVFFLSFWKLFILFQIVLYLSATCLPFD